MNLCWFSSVYCTCSRITSYNVCYTKLLRIKAKKLIQKADVLVYSGSLIPSQILKLCKKGKLHDASKLVREEIFDLLKNNAKKNKNVIRLHDGDPTIYSYNFV